ncbi:MAG TPA: hypothetical protein VFQ38_11870 [Longimicrobiales bacterium]|nr:hypothetical protein [Longimicrobiales bacterium]
MVESPGSGDAASPEIPLGQRLFDNWPLLMVAGVLIMVVIFTLWGLWEIYTMPVATLP